MLLEMVLYCTFHEFLLYFNRDLISENELYIQRFIYIYIYKSYIIYLARLLQFMHKPFDRMTVCKNDKVSELIKTFIIEM